MKIYNSAFDHLNADLPSLQIYIWKSHCSGDIGKDIMGLKQIDPHVITLVNIVSWYFQGRFLCMVVPEPTV